jgi:tetratricopeptide (TPR) repeat protein
MENREPVESPPAAGADYAGQAAEQLWQRWRQKQGPTLQEVLAHAGELTAAQLALALGAEQHQHWQEGKRTPAEAYLQQYAVLSADEEAACDLVYGEFLVRQELGEAPSLQEYLERFPRLADALKQLHEYAQFNSVLHWLPLDSTADSGERPSPTPPNLPDYELLKWIGAGTFGQVWLARNRHDGGLCAVKIVAKSHQSELDGVRLYRQSASDHPSLVAIKHVGEGDGFYYYVMPLADDVREGTLSQAPEQYEPMTLRRHLAWRQRLPADEVVAIARQLLSALVQLHKRGVSHCDVKPDNVLRVRGNWQLGDMGLATPSAQMGAERGTLAFFPPEGPHDQTADLYALGKTLYLLLTGAGLERFTEFADGTLEIPGGDPRGRRLRQFILRACHPDARQRFDSAAAMLRALDESFAGRRRKYRLLAATCVLVIMVGGGLLILGKVLWPGGGNPDSEAKPSGLTLDQTAQVEKLRQRVQELQKASNFAEAVEVQEELVKVLTAALGTKHNETLAAQQVLDLTRGISAMSPRARYDVAKDLRAGFTLAQREEYLRIAKDLRKLQNAGKFAEAAKVEEQQLKIHIRVFGPTNDSVIGAQIHLDTTRRLSHMPRQAQDELGKVFELMENIPNRFAQGYLAEAIADQRTALAVLQKHIKVADLEVARTMLYLGYLLKASKEYEESEEWSKKSLEMLLGLYGGNENSETTTARNNLAGCQFTKGRYDLAEKEYRNVRDIRLKLLGPANELTIISRIHLGKTLRKLKQNAEANKEFHQAGVECVQMSDDDDSKAWICIALAEDHEGQKESQQAQAYLERALRIILRLHGEESVAAAGVRFRLAANFVAQGKAEGAKEHVTKALGFIMPRMLPLNATVGSMEPPVVCLAGLALELKLVSNPPAGVP